MLATAGLWDILPWVLVGLLAVLAGWMWRRRGRSSGMQTHIQTTIEAMRSVGELVVFKIIAKEIVTSSDHWLKDFGRKYLSWLVSEKKVAIIFEFEIDFRFDLRSNAFRIEHNDTEQARIVMPPCRYEIALKGQRYYHEQESHLLPDLLPQIISPTGKLSEEDRNKLFEEARQAAELLAVEYVHSMRSEVQKSARQTMEQMAQSLGIERVSVDFTENDDFEPAGEVAQEAALVVRETPAEPDVS